MIISTVFLKSKFIPIILILIIQMFMSIYNRVFVIPSYRKSGFVIITIILITVILSIILFVSQGERIAVIFSGIIAMLVIIFEKFFYK
ncbi:MAG: hypothetical protein FH753_02615 [Firmicutes bacterium]|nr:hypothetical protein [Bacillota bacterium]